MRDGRRRQPRRQWADGRPQRGTQPRYLSRRLMFSAVCSTAVCRLQFCRLPSFSLIRPILRSPMRLRLTVALAIASPAAAQQQLSDDVATRVDAVFARFARPDSPAAPSASFRTEHHLLEGLRLGKPRVRRSHHPHHAVHLRLRGQAVHRGGDRAARGRAIRSTMMCAVSPSCRTTARRSPSTTSSTTRAAFATSGHSCRSPGMRYDDGYAVGNVIRLAARQKHLNFPPGTEYDYSNTGYIALGPSCSG